VIADPDGGRRLSEGLVLEASVVARLLRIRLLVIDASVVITPARVKGPAPVRTSSGRESPLPPPVRAHPIGEGLAAAERSLSDGAASLAQSRRYQSPSPASPARR
jgi:hypothetical protein